MIMMMITMFLCLFETKIVILKKIDNDSNYNNIEVSVIFSMTMI